MRLRHYRGARTVTLVGHSFCCRGPLTCPTQRWFRTSRKYALNASPDVVYLPRGNPSASVRRGGYSHPDRPTEMYELPSLLIYGWCRTINHPWCNLLFGSPPKHAYGICSAMGPKMCDGGGHGNGSLTYTLSGSLRETDDPSCNVARSGPDCWYPVGSVSNQANTSCPGANTPPCNMSTTSCYS